VRDLISGAGGANGPVSGKSFGCIPDTVNSFLINKGGESASESAGGDFISRGSSFGASSASPSCGLPSEHGGSSAIAVGLPAARRSGGGGSPPLGRPQQLSCASR